MSIKRIFLPLVVSLALLGAIGASGASSAPSRAATSTHAAMRSLTIDVRLIQEATFHDPDQFLSTTLHLYAIGEQLGFTSNTYLGSMFFKYQIHGVCSASTAGCSGTTNLMTVTSFPGGTITAGGAHIRLVSGLVVPVQSGTGIFKGVSGTILIAPGDAAESIYRLTLPS